MRDDFGDGLLVVGAAVEQPLRHDDVVGKVRGDTQAISGQRSYSATMIDGKSYSGTLARIWAVLLCVKRERFLCVSWQTLPCKPSSASTTRVPW